MKEERIRAVIFGATGLAGSGVLEECLKHERVEKVTVITRKRLAKKYRKNKKVVEVLHKDYQDYSNIMDDLRGHNACFYCLGISQSDVKDEKKYTEITYDYTMAAADAMVEANGPDMVSFCFLSGSGSDSQEKSFMMWARIKGKAENDLGKYKFKALYNFRPALIHPVHGQPYRYKIGYVFGALYPVIDLLMPSWIITTKEWGLGNINAVLYGYKKRILENQDIKQLGRRK